LSVVDSVLVANLNPGDGDVGPVEIGDGTEDKEPEDEKIAHG
jgi:hypothetical protein